MNLTQFNNHFRCAITFSFCSLLFIHLAGGSSIFPSLSTTADTTGIKPAQTVLNNQGFSGYLRLCIENDMLVLRHKTDRYFTSGVKGDWYFLKNPTSKYWLSRIFPQLKTADTYFGITAASNMYTPANMSAQIQQNDRPYAGWVYVGANCISNDLSTTTRFTTEYSLGVIGPAALQKPIQRKWHQIIERPLPQGWHNQIANDIALTLSFTGEKRLLKPADFVEVNGILEANVGTVMNYMGFGGLVRVGWFDDYFNDIFQVNGRHNTVQAYVYMRPLVRIVADNALLQGGMLTYKKSPYTIPRDDINRYYLNSEFGYCLSYRQFNITYSQSLRTPEFRGAKNMFWGAVQFSFCL
jgi:hypothetical protein